MVCGDGVGNGVGHRDLQDVPAGFQRVSGLEHEWAEHPGAEVNAVQLGAARESDIPQVKEAALPWILARKAGAVAGVAAEVIPEIGTPVAEFRLDAFFLRY